METMEKATRVEGSKVSRQTVNNKVLSMKDVVTEAKRKEITTKELHIFADEDHVHLRPNSISLGQRRSFEDSNASKLP